GAQAAGPERHRVGPDPGRYHPSEAAQNRRNRAHQRPPHRAPDELRLSLERHLCTSLPRSALLNTDSDFDYRTSIFAEPSPRRSHDLNPSPAATPDPLPPTASLPR